MKDFEDNSNYNDMNIDETLENVRTYTYIVLDAISILTNTIDLVSDKMNHNDIEAYKISVLEMIAEKLGYDIKGVL